MLLGAGANDDLAGILVLAVTAVVVVLAAAAGVLMGSTGTLGGPSQLGRQNIRGVRIDAYTTRPALDVNQSGTGLAADFAGPVNFDSTVTGVITFTNDLDGTDLIIDTDGDTVLNEVSDDDVRLTSGTATGLWNVLTGNLKVGNGTPAQTLNGEDAYVEGTLEVDNTAYLKVGLDLVESGIVSALELEVQVQCSNCGGKKVHSREVKSKQGEWESMPKGGSSLLWTLWDLTAVLLALTLVGIPVALLMMGFMKLRLGYKQEVLAAHYTCEICGNEWDWDPSEPPPPVTVRPDLILKGNELLQKQEEERRRAVFVMSPVGENRS